MSTTTATNLSYRRAVLADAPIICALAMQVYLDTYAPDGIDADMADDVFSAHSLSSIEAKLDDPNVEVIVAQSGNYVVGFVSVRKVSTCPIATVTGSEIMTLYVQRRFHQHGIGRKLTALAETVAMQAAKVTNSRTDQSIWLKAWAGNAPALAFYPRIGYADVGMTYYQTAQNKYENRVFAKRLVPTET